MKISKKTKKRFFVMSQGSFNPKIKFLGQKVYLIARLHTDRQTCMKVNTEDALSGFQEFFLQPIIKDRSNRFTNLLTPLATVECLFFAVLSKSVKHGG